MFFEINEIRKNHASSEINLIMPEITGTTEYFNKIQYNRNSENWKHNKLLFLR